eukprot:CAMPEP_0118934134 /NCGR_PEP_ID=MMETSP1169-20130426/13657_1 /TAXON_ID=36882 /ORGANISM="Pyramimonas obovata, Strain CCMP722" /LENGTH=102 /DNA_ID=CAMNT_0006877005 /DNA_START=252 /DNA_END=560 /DNA_ORIENTATION=+
MPPVETCGQPAQPDYNDFDMDLDDEIEVKSAGKLRDVVLNATQRWFREALEGAQAGEYRQMALLGEMLAEGYGCVKDPEAAAHWTERARKGRAYRDRVYCEL